MPNNWWEKRTISAYTVWATVFKTSENRLGCKNGQSFATQVQCHSLVQWNLILFFETN